MTEVTEVTEVTIQNETRFTSQKQTFKIGAAFDTLGSKPPFAAL